MSLSRREEAFRYVFAEPINGTFQMTKIDGMDMESKSGPFTILDLSLHGARISTPYDFHIEGMKIELTLHFRIRSMPFSIPGMLVYHQHLMADDQYGVHLYTDEATKELMMNELKAYAWDLVRKKPISHA